MNYTPEQKEAWDKAIGLLEKNLMPIKFNTWIKPLQLYSVTPESIIIIADNPLTLSSVKTRYFTDLYNMIKLSFGRSYELEFYTQDEIDRQQVSIKRTTLNSKYSFENFVVGSSNSFAYAASLAVAEQPGDVYNPLFIYGSVGLGKTHLMNAIGNYIMADDPMKNVLLTTSESFTNELIDAIVKKKDTSELRDRMRNVDVLMVDDIQFLSKTKATQEEFFHTFNDLHKEGKQIIISSDRPPKDIPTIEERLRSRFGSGLIVDIKKPDFETRVAILKRKCDEEYIDLPYDVMEYIAAHFDKSIRELEGALTRVFAQSKLMGYPISMELAMNALGNLAQTEDTRVVTPSIIIDTVARGFGVDPKEILSKKRNREIAVPRQVAIYICRELTELSYPAIGREFGGRDHTTVMHSCEKVSEQMQTDFAFKKRVEELISQVKSH